LGWGDNGLWLYHEGCGILKTKLLNIKLVKFDIELNFCYNI
jgi:hypothetical protein